MGPREAESRHLQGHDASPALQGFSQGDQVLQHHRRIGGQYDRGLAARVADVQHAEHAAADVDHAHSRVAAPAGFRRPTTRASSGIPGAPP